MWIFSGTTQRIYLLLKGGGGGGGVRFDIQERSQVVFNWQLEGVTFRYY